MNQNQAKAIHSVLCALNDVSGSFESIEFPIPGNGLGSVIKIATENGYMIVNTDTWKFEHYPTQQDFFTAYGLN